MKLVNVVLCPCDDSAQTLGQLCEESGSSGNDIKYCGYCNLHNKKKVGNFEPADVHPILHHIPSTCIILHPKCTKDVIINLFH